MKESKEIEKKMRDTVEMNAKYKKELIDYEYNMEIQNDKMKL